MNIIKYTLSVFSRFVNNPAVVLKSFQVLIRLEVCVGGYSFLKEEVLSLCGGALKSVLCQCNYMNSNTQFQVNVTARLGEAINKKEQFLFYDLQ